jgi:integrase
MARLVDRLTDRQIKTVRTEQPLMLADGKSLYLRVWPEGSKSWIFRYQRHRSRHDLGLGPYPDITLAEARRLATEQRRLCLAGQDPLAARRAVQGTIRAKALKTMTFAECAERYMDAHRAGWKNPKHRQQWENTLATYVYPVFGELPVQAVDTGLVMQVIEPLWSTKPETASRVRGRIEVILDWATTRGYRQGENPARWKGHLENLLPKRSKVRRVEHHSALPYTEIGNFVTELRQQEGISATALEFAILTATRTGEVLGARWEEIDRDQRLWIVPANRMKAGREHRIPLSAAALAILDAMYEAHSSEFVFPGSKSGKPLSNMALLMLLRRTGRADVTVHGFRSCFADWCAEQTSFSSEVREMALAHAVSDKVEAAYRRGDLFAKRRQLMDAWAQFIAADRSGNVVPLQQVAASR